MEGSDELEGWAEKEGSDEPPPKHPKEDEGATLVAESPVVVAASGAVCLFLGLGVATCWFRLRPRGVGKPKGSSPEACPDAVADVEARPAAPVLGKSHGGTRESDRGDANKGDDTDIGEELIWQTASCDAMPVVISVDWKAFDPPGYHLVEVRGGIINTSNARTSLYQKLNTIFEGEDRTITPGPEKRFTTVHVADKDLPAVEEVIKSLFKAKGKAAKYESSWKGMYDSDSDD